MMQLLNTLLVMVGQSVETTGPAMKTNPPTYSTLIVDQCEVISWLLLPHNVACWSTLHLQVHRLVGTTFAVILVLVSRCDGGATLQDPSNLYPPSVVDTNGDLAIRCVHALPWTRSLHQWLLDLYSLWKW